MYFCVGLFIMLYIVALPLGPKVQIKWKILSSFMWYFSMLYKFILSFAPVNEILDCDHSIQRYHSVLYTFCCAVQGGSKVSSVTLKWEV